MKNKINFIKNLNEKCLNSIIENKILEFDLNEQNFIKNDLKLYESIDDEESEETIKLLHLLANIESNLEKDLIANIRNILSIPYKYFSDKEIHNYCLYGLNLGELSKITKEIESKRLSIEQDQIYQFFNSEYNIFLKAKTGFGKTFLSTNYLLERFKNYNHNDNQKFIFIVPTELLETQIIEDLHSRYNEFSMHIGNNINVNNVFIGTWEKLVSVINQKEILIDINTIIIDEAQHLCYNDERSIFLQHLIKIYFNKKSAKKIILLSPFDIDKKILRDNFGEKNNFIPLSLFNVKRVNKWNITNKLIIKKYNTEKYKKFITNSTKFISCILVRTKKEAKKKAESLFNNNDLIENISKSINNDEFIDKNEYTKEIMSLENDFPYLKKYLNLNYIKKGICYLTADVPDSVKKKIIDLVNKRYIRIIIGTSLIISGIDLPIDITLSETNKINDKEMNANDLINFFGRAGRIGKQKKAYGVGISLSKIDNKEKKEWWNSNEKYILENLCENKSFEINDFQNKNDNAIRLSMERFKETLNPIYLYEPRVFPNITDYVNSLNISDKEYYQILKLIFISKDNTKKQKNNLSILILAIFLIYDINSFKNQKNIDFNKFNKKFENNFSSIIENSKEIWEKISTSKKNLNEKWVILNIKFYIENNFSIEEGLKKFIHQDWLKGCDDKNTTKQIERYIDCSKEFGKYYFVMFLNHIYLLIKNESIYNNISIISNTCVFDKNFYNFLNERNLLRIIENNIMNNNDNLIKKEWRKINDIDNNIIKINEEIKSNKKILQIFISNDKNFSNELEKYVKNIKII